MNDANGAFSHAELVGFFAAVRDRDLDALRLPRRQPGAHRGPDRRLPITLGRWQPYFCVGTRRDQSWPSAQLCWPRAICWPFS